MNPTNRRNCAASMLRKTCLSVFVAMALGTTAYAQQSTATAQYAVAAGDLVQAINQISRSSGVQIVYDIELLRGKRAAEVKGAMTLEQALDRALSGSGLGWIRVNATTVSIYGKPDGGKRDRKPSRPEHGPEQGSQRNDVGELDEVVVVGSRLGGSPVESAMPIKVITREDIDRSGAGNIAQALMYLSEMSLNSGGDREIGATGISSTSGANTNSTTAQMRGLPRGTTLVLINGRRAGDSAMFSATGQFDLSTIPLAMVERIEVLPAGSSAVYGGDGLAGVINIVLKRDAQGAELRIRKTVAEGYDRDMVSAMWGKAWSRGSVTVTANWNRNSPLLSAERSITADQDYRRFGGVDQRSTSGYPATIYSLAGCPSIGSCRGVPLASRAPLPGLDSPVATVPLGNDGTGLVPSDFVATQGQVNKTSASRHLISAQQNRGISISGRTEVTPKLELFSEFSYTKRTVPALQIWFSTYDGEFGNAAARIEADHPYNPFGVPVGVDYRYNDTGLYAAFSQKYMRGLLGARGKFGRFDWEVSGMQSRDRGVVDGASGFDRTRVAAALAEKDPARALNLFSTDGSPPASREVLASMLATDLNHDTASRSDVWTGFVRGPIFRLPAGEMQALVGLERQRQEIRLDTNSVSSIAKYINGVTTSNAAFAEVRVPVLSARTGSARERVALTGAMRRESSNRFKGTTHTETLGLEAWVTEKLMLRATYSTAFRPLLAYSAVRESVESVIYFLDPKFGNSLQTAPGFYGGVGGVPPDLGPENSKTTTMGLLYRPSSDLSFSLTHWDMKFRDRITSISVDTMLANEEQFQNRVVRDPVTGYVSFLDMREINMSRYDSAGVDISGEAYLQSGIGEFNFGLSATYTYKHESQLTDEVPIVDNVAIRRADGWAPRWKIVPRVGWTPDDGMHVMVAGRYVSRYRDSVAFSTGPNAGKFPELGGIWIADLNAEIELDRWMGRFPALDRTRLTFGITNILDRKPEFCASCGINGYDASIYDIVGRAYYTELRLSF